MYFRITAGLCNKPGDAGLNRLKAIKTMKTKIIILTSLISAGLLLGTTAYARGGGGNGGGNRGNGGGTPVRDGSGQSVNPDRGNPNSNGTPVQDGSGKTTAPGKGAKDGSGNQAGCPIPPKT